jgi:hypothetical protein
MDKSDKEKVVLNALKKVKEEYTPEVYAMLGVNQRLQLIQDRLPTKPLYSTAKIREIVFAANAR